MHVPYGSRMPTSPYAGRPLPCRDMIMPQLHLCVHATVHRYTTLNSSQNSVNRVVQASLVYSH